MNETQHRIAIARVATCKIMTSTCRSLADRQDPLGLGNNAEVNKACSDAYTNCVGMHNGFDRTLSVYDIAAPALAPFSHTWAAGYLNNAEVQQALGVPLNFTSHSNSVQKGEISAQDPENSE